MHVRTKNGDLKAIKPSNLRKLRVHSSSSPESAKVKSLFRKYDTNADGAFQASEFKRFLVALGLDKMCTDSIRKRVDTNEDGLIQYEEFVDWVLGDEAMPELLSPTASPTKMSPGRPLGTEAVIVDDDSDSDDDSDAKRQAHRDLTVEDVKDLCGEVPYGWPDAGVRVLNNLRRRFPDFAVQRIVNQMRSSSYHGGHTMQAIRKTGTIEVDVMPPAMVVLNRAGKHAFPAMYKARPWHSEDSGLPVYEQSGANFTFRNLRDGRLEPVGSIALGTSFRVWEVRKDPECGAHYARIYWGTNDDRYHWVNLGRDLSLSRRFSVPELNFIGAERLDPC